MSHIDDDFDDRELGSARLTRATESFQMAIDYLSDSRAKYPVLDEYVQNVQDHICSGLYSIGSIYRVIKLLEDRGEDIADAASIENAIRKL